VSRTAENPRTLESRLNSAGRIVLAARTTRQLDETTPKQRESDSPYLFRSYEIEEFDPDNPPRNYGVDINHSITAVCCATTAVPPLYGGFGANNPTIEALEEMDRLHKKRPRISASFGTGMPPPVPVVREGRLQLLRRWRVINKHGMFENSSMWDCEETHWKVQEIAELLADGPKGFQYFRFNVEEDLGNVPFDEYKTNRDDGMGGKCSTFEYISRCTDMELAKPQVQEQLRELATQLVKLRRQRIRDDPDRWERFACCTVYICSDDECRNDGKAIFNLRREMRAHLQIIHELPEGEQGQEMEMKLDECRKLPKTTEHPGGPVKDGIAF
jgi:hypothetical protein